MILPTLGKLSTAQAFTSAQTKDSENVILMPAVDWAGLTDVWWVVDTTVVATGDNSDTYQFQLVLSQESTLDTNVEVLSRTVTGYASKCLATAGLHIVCVNLGKMINEIMQADLSDYPYLGQITAVSNGATLTMDAAITPVEPSTRSHAQTTVSNVGVPDLAS
jgi:hypothetical protein